jgi:RNA polymerase sigma factor (sigma-70 family)
MDEESDPESELQAIINRFNRGDIDARDELIKRSCDRLRRLTSRILAGFPTVSRWEQTDDVFQQCSLALYRALDQVRPQNVRAFMGLAAVQIRRKVIDLARHYQGPLGLGANHATDFGKLLADVEFPDQQAVAQDPSAGPLTLQIWAEFHETIGRLPEEELEVFDLIYYQGMTQTQVAKMLELSERTVKRRWRSAKLMLHDWLS